MLGPGLRADLALMAVALAWGASFVVLKDALDMASAHWITFLRFAVASVALAAIFPAAIRALDGAAWRAAGVLGPLLYGGFALQAVGLAYTTPAKSAFLTATYVPLVPLLGRVFFGARVSARVAFGIALGFAGLILLTHPEAFARINRGDLLTLASALAFALHILALDRVAPRLPSQVLAILQILATAGMALPLALWLGAPRLAYPASFYGAILFLGLACSALAYWVQSWAQRHTPPARVALIFALEAVFAALFSVVLWGERLTPGEWLGGAMVFGAILLARGTEEKPN